MQHLYFSFSLFCIKEINIKCIPFDKLLFAKLHLKEVDMCQDLSDRKHLES